MSTRRVPDHLAWLEDVVVLFGARVACGGETCGTNEQQS